MLAHGADGTAWPLLTTDSGPARVLCFLCTKAPPWRLTQRRERAPSTGPPDAHAVVAGTSIGGPQKLPWLLLPR